MAFASELRAAPWRSGAIRRASPRPASGGQQRVERLRGRSGHGRQGSRPALGPQAACLGSSTPRVGGSSAGLHWRIPDRPCRSGHVDEDDLSGILDEGLKLHLESDVPLAVLLSGGVDSSAVAHHRPRLAARELPDSRLLLAFEAGRAKRGPIAGARSPPPLGPSTTKSC